MRNYISGFLIFAAVVILGASSARADVTPVPSPTPIASPTPTATPTPTPTPSPSPTEQKVVYLTDNGKLVAVQASPQILAQAPGTVKELPKTGLPLMGWAFASLIPGGALLKRFAMKKDKYEDSVNSVWMERAGKFK